MNEKIITRFAPSPTGELHIGGVRTALFEYLFAKKNNGEWLLRIEDTDRERFVAGSQERIIESLKWLDLVPINLDNIPIQSQRSEIYKKYALELVKSGHAYVCNCSKERLENLRKEQEIKKLPPRYDRKCISLNLKYAEGCVIRFKMPDKKFVFNDIVRGQIEFDSKLIDDPILLKSDGYATYHLAAIVDDHEMNVTHVIRGEEWLSSTPKHLAIYEAFGWKAPAFAHLPVILGPDKKHKLSKRDGDVSVFDFKKKGYLPEAILNFLALLGWNPGDDREFFTLAELEKEFSLERVQKSPAVFNIEKLNSINQHYINELVQNQKSKVKSLLEEFELKDITDGEMDLLSRGGFKTLKEMADTILELRKQPEYAGEMLIFKKSDKTITLKALLVVSNQLSVVSNWNANSLQKLLSDAVAENNMTNGDVFWPVRVALSGAERSPSPVELLVALGKDESLKRIEKAIEKI